MKIFCVIPAYNEEKNIVRVVESVRACVDCVVVVDDGSNDNTYGAAKSVSGVVVLRHVINRGQGAALQTGNDYALQNGADIIVHFDADGQFQVEGINDVIAPIKAGKADMVFGSRFLGKNSNMPWFKKNIIFNLARIFNKVFFGINLTDPQSGFRAMNRRVACLIRIHNDGAAHCSEILIGAFKNKLDIKEVPITVVYDRFGQGVFGGKGRGTGGVKIVWDLFLSKILN